MRAPPAWLSSVATVAFLTGLGLFAWRDVVTTSAVAPASARLLVEELTKRERFAASPGMTESLDVVELALRRAGATTRRDERWRAAPSGFVYARSIIADVKGTGGGVHVVLNAHADAVGYSPGAGDDAVGVAAVVEALRVASAAKMRGDVTAVISAHEELCPTCTPDAASIGGDAFIVLDSAGNALPLVVNYAPNHGIALVGAGNETLAWSFVSDFAALLGLVQHRTELAALTGTKPGVHVGFAGGVLHYHQACDSAANLGAGALAAMVRAATEAVRIANTPAPLAVDGDALSFRFFTTVRAPRAAFTGVALLGLALAAAGLVRRRRTLRLKSALAAAFASSAACVVVAMLTSLVMPPGESLIVHGTAFGIGVAALAVGAFLAVSALFATEERGLVALLLVVVTLAASAYLPGAATLAAALGVYCASTLCAPRGVGRTARVLGAVPAVVLASHALVVLGANFNVLDVYGVAIASFIALLVASTGLSELARAARVVVAVVACGVGAFGLAYAAVAPWDEACPKPYVLDAFVDADRATTQLFALEEGVLETALGGAEGVRRDKLERWRPLNQTELPVKDVLHLALPAPSARLVEVKDVDGARHWRVRLAVGTFGVLRLSDDGGGKWREVSVGSGESRVALPDAPAEFFGISSAGLDVTIVTELDRERLELRLEESVPQPALGAHRACGGPHTPWPSPIAHVVKRETLTRAQAR